VRSGASWSQQDKLTADDGAPYDYFGRAVSLSGDGSTALVGADAYSYYTMAGSGAGSAYVFVRTGNTWSRQARLVAWDRALFDGFGNAVSLSADGNTALVGAYLATTPAGTNAGSAYVFVRSGNTWNQQFKLVEYDGAAQDWFGKAVSLSGDGNTAMVGSPFANTPTVTEAGSAYVFVRSGNIWGQQAKLMANDRAPIDSFGWAVSLSADGNTALVGACSDTTPEGGTAAGSAYVFVRSGVSWSQETHLEPPSSKAIDHFFGSDVSLSGDGKTALVGAPMDDTPAGTNAGSAYVFVRSGTNWSLQARLTANDGASRDYLGGAVSLSGDGNTALVGAYMATTPAGTNAGSAYVFVRSGANWTQQAKLAADSGAADDYFGWAVSLSQNGNTALVGAKHENTMAGEHAGSAYVFARSGTSWSQQAKLTAADGIRYDALGCAVSLSGDGDTALIGTSGESAYVFVRSGINWSQQAKLVASDPEVPDVFGGAVSLSGDGNAALIGASLDDAPWRDSGSAYVFVRSGPNWSQEAKLTAADGRDYDYFGCGVSLSGDGSRGLVGAIYDDTAVGTNSGSAYVFAGSPAAITVTSLTDSGEGSLREALAVVRAGGTISLAVTGMMTLTTGELLIDKDLRIVGPGATNLVIDGNRNGRVFNITPGANVNISSLTVSNGAVAGALGGDAQGGGSSTPAISTWRIVSSSATRSPVAMAHGWSSADAAKGAGCSAAARSE
jgi:hypothetical protein